MHTAPAPLRLKTALGNHPHVAPLKDGSVRSDLVELECIEIAPLPLAFRRMLREGDLDLSEMAVCSHLLGVDAGCPITALPIPLWSRYPHDNLLCPLDATLAGPAGLQGKCVGVRSYAQTSGVWVRGILQAVYGVDLDSIRWITLEDAHVESFVDPANASRAQAGVRLRDLMQRGEVQAIMGERDIDPAGVRTVIPASDPASRTWFTHQRIEPVHHILSARLELFHGRPWLAAELARMFAQARQKALDSGAAAVPVYGLEENRRSLDAILGFSHDQKLTRRRYPVDDIFKAA